jgi:fumarate hydratase class II
MSDAMRVERDTMGEVEVPAEALYGASTERARQNFPIGGGPLPPPLIRALGLLKAAAARVHAGLGLLDADLAAAIDRAATEVADGVHDAWFVVDVFQTGSGTSSNMNANEVIANRAAELLGAARGSGRVHPNDHVNLGQSSNDLFPSAVQLGLALVVAERLLPALRGLAARLHEQADRHWDLVKTGRTHLMDAMPIRFGQQLRGYAGQIEDASARIEAALDEVQALPLGGTAVGTGVNAHPEAAGGICALLGRELGLPRLRETGRHLHAQACVDVVVAASAALRGLASALFKIGNDLRWMASGPSAGLGELRIPAVQPGSSIMPAKVNPVIPEAVLMVCVQVFGNDQVVGFGNALGQFELNTMLPLIGRSVIESATLLAGACATLDARCVAGLEGTRAGAEAVARNPILATALNAAIGYEAAAAIAKEAAQGGRTVFEVALERTELGAERLRELLDPARLAGERGRTRED